MIHTVSYTVYRDTYLINKSVGLPVYNHTKYPRNMGPVIFPCTARLPIDIVNPTSLVQRFGHNVLPQGMYPVFIYICLNISLFIIILCLCTSLLNLRSLEIYYYFMFMYIFIKSEIIRNILLFYVYVHLY